MPRARPGELDPFAVAVMAELGQDISGHRPMTFEALEDWEGLNFDLIITLSPEAHHKALELTRTHAVEVEYWPTHNPAGTEGNREQKLQVWWIRSSLWYLQAESVQRTSDPKPH